MVLHRLWSSQSRSILRSLPLAMADLESRRGRDVGSSWAQIFFSFSAYTHLGCWKDTGRRAVPQIDGSDPRIRGAYQRRANAINKCYQVARERKMVLFAIQHGGWCAAAPNFKGYQRYGRSNKCRNGKGGPWANDVYRITNPIRPALPKGRYHPEVKTN